MGREGGVCGCVLYLCLGQYVCLNFSFVLPQDFPCPKDKNKILIHESLAWRFWSDFLHVLVIMRKLLCRSQRKGRGVRKKTE